MVPAYSTFGPATLDRDALVAAARAATSAGQHRLKMVVAAYGAPQEARGLSLEDVLREDIARIRAVREAVGPDVSLFIDANHGLNEYEARRFIDRIREFDLALFEEPLRGNDVRRLADLRRYSPIPLSAGQNEGHIARWRDMAVNDSVDILQLNVCMCGGYTGALKVAGLAQAFAMPMDNGGGYALFNMHLHAGVANGGMVEWHVSSVQAGARVLRPAVRAGERQAAPAGAAGTGLRPEARDPAAAGVGGLQQRNLDRGARAFPAQQATVSRDAAGMVFTRCDSFEGHRFQSRDFAKAYASYRRCARVQQWEQGVRNVPGSQVHGLRR